MILGLYVMVGILIFLSTLIIINHWFNHRWKNRQKLMSGISNSLENSATNSYEKNIQDKLEIVQNELLNQKKELMTLIHGFKDQSYHQDKQFIEKVSTLNANLKNLEQNLTVQDKNLKNNLNEQNMQLDHKLMSLIKDLTELKNSSKTLISLDESVKNIQNIFINSKKRGNVGEYLLETILNDIYGNNPSLWKKQYLLPSGQIVDAYVNLGTNKEGIAIDAKFSFSNYNKHLETSDKVIQNKFLQEFKKDFKARIDEVSKYINHENNISSAIMFVPSENIFSFVCAEFPETIVSYALKKKVWLASPTILSAILFVIDKHTKEVKLNQNIELIKKTLNKFKNDWERWINRWDDFRATLNKIPERINNLDHTHHKIKCHYEKILVNREFDSETPQIADVINDELNENNSQF